MKNRQIAKISVRFVKYKEKRTSLGSRSVFTTHNFSDIEDNANAFRIIRSLALNAGNNASAEAKAAGVARVYARNNNELVKVLASGEVVLVSPKLKRPSFYIKYNTSTVLNAVKK